MLDRLLWFDSIGHRHFRTKAGAWWWVRDDDGEAVVNVAAAFVGASTGLEPIDLARPDLAEQWRSEARAALVRARGQFP